MRFLHTPSAGFAARRAIVSTLMALPLLAGSGVSAQTYPSRPIQVIVPYTAGGNTDVMARGFLEALQATTGIATIVTNRDGAGGTVGFAQLKAARPDGYTLVFSPNSPLSSAPHLMKSLPYTPADFIAVCGVFENIFAIAVAPQSRYDSLKSLMEEARRRPGAVSFGTAGVASVGHLAGEGFAQKLGLSFNHIPFRGEAQMHTQILGGQIDFGLLGMGSAVGILRPLAIFSDKRLPFLPDVPTTMELGLPSTPPGYQGLFAPKGTPPEIVARLTQACEKATRSAQFAAYAAGKSQKVAYSSAEKFAALIAEDSEYKERVIKQLGIKPE